jgi:hypothetical protein
MTIADKSLDIAFVALNYHDLFFTHTIRDGKTTKLRDKIVDYKAALATIKKALKKMGYLSLSITQPSQVLDMTSPIHCTASIQILLGFN